MLNGKEIVQADYEPAKTSLSLLVEALKKQQSFYSVIVANAQEQERVSRIVPKADIKVETARPAYHQSKYSLRARHPEFVALDLTEAQAIALNSWSYFGGPMPDVLTPEQKNKLASHKEKLQE